MRFLEILGREALAAHTPWLLVALIAVAALVRRLPRLHRPRRRLPVSLFTIHAALVVAASAQIALGYDPQALRLASLAFFLLAALSVIGIALFRLLLPSIGMGVPRILVDIVTAVAVIVVVIFIGKRAGFSVAGLITTSAVLTAVIGFAMQDTLGNIMGGLALQLDNSIQVGDWVSLGTGQPTGKVTEIRWRYTALETRNWETIVVPNSVLMKTSIVLLGKRSVPARMLRRIVEFNVDFRTPPTDVITAVQNAIRSDPPQRTATDPAPQVVFMGVRDSYAVYGIIYWVTDFESDLGPDSDIRVRMFYALRRASIQLSIPAQALFITQESSERDVRKETEEVERRLALVDRVDLFRPIQGELRRHLADALTYAPFAQGEAVTRENTVGDDALYVIVQGEASVRLGGPTGRQVALLGAGQFFGEMSMMTGEKRSATVIAVSDLICYRLDKSAFERVLREHPDVAEEVAEVLAERREELDAAKGELEDVRRRRLQTEKENLLGRIRGFFNLFDGD